MLSAVSGILEERVAIGRDPRLEAVLSYPADQTRCACLLAPPHPFMGGTLANNVLRQLAMVLPEAGGVCLRFNYRGVGESEGAPVDVLAGMQQFWDKGHAPHDPLLIEDCRTARRWLQDSADLPLLGIGYSFGSYALVASGLSGFSGLIFIVPTLRHHDFQAAASSDLPKLILYSDNDFATPCEAVEKWVQRLAGPVKAVCIPQGQHFFRDQEREVAECCRDFMLQTLGEESCDA